MLIYFYRSFRAIPFFVCTRDFWVCVCGKLFNFLQFKFQTKQILNWREREKPFILAESWKRKTNWKQFHTKYSTKFSRSTIEVSDTKNIHTLTIVIRLYAISIDSILFERNIFYVREKSILLRLPMEKIQYRCYQTTPPSPPMPLQTLNFAIFLISFFLFLAINISIKRTFTSIYQIQT